MFNSKVWLVVLLLGSCLSCSYAVANTQPSQDIVVYQKVRILIGRGDFAAAQKKAQTYLNKNPRHSDILFLLGLSYYRQHNYAKTITILCPVVSRHPKYLDVRLLLINAFLAQGEYLQAQKYIETGLKLDAQNPKLLAKKQQVQAELRSQKHVIINSSKAEYAVGEYLNLASDVRQVWTRTFAQIKYKTQYADFIAHLAAITQFQNGTFLYRLEVYPKLSWGYGHFAYGHATNKIFPPNRYLGEAYLTHFKPWVFSLGARYIQAYLAPNVDIYTGSIGVYWRNYLLRFRSYVSHSLDNKAFSSYLSVRRYSDDVHYWQILFGGGRAVDDFDVRDNEMDVLTNRKFAIKWCWPLTSKIDVVNSLGYQHYKLKWQRNRDQYTLGLEIRF